MEGKFQDFRKHSEKFYLLVLTEAKFRRAEDSELQSLNKIINVAVDQNCLSGKLRCSLPLSLSPVFPCNHQSQILTLYSQSTEKSKCNVYQSQKLSCHSLQSILGLTAFLRETAMVLDLERCCCAAQQQTFIISALISPMNRTTLIDERRLRDANKDKELLVLINLRFHKVHTTQPDTSLLVFAAGTTQEGSKLLVKDLQQASRFFHGQDWLLCTAFLYLNELLIANGNSLTMCESRIDSIVFESRTGDS